MEEFKVLDNVTGLIETVKQTTTTSWLITRTKLSNKGINSDNWFDMTLKVNKERFKKL